MTLIADLPVAPIDFTNAEGRAGRHVLYCPHTGRRINPSQGAEPPARAPVAVVVFDRGETLPVTRDTLFGRSPYVDRKVLSNQRDSVLVADADDAVSRCHLLLRVRQWNIEAIDLGSRNGTLSQTAGDGWQRLVPGVPYQVADGQRLRIGSRVLTVHLTARHETR